MLFSTERIAVLSGLCVWLMTTVVLAGCGRDATFESSPGNDVQVEAAANQPANGDQEQAADAGIDGQDVAALQRQIIFTAAIRLVVSDFATLEESLPKLVNQHKGYIADANVDRRQGSYRTGRWVIRVPTQEFGNLLDEIEELGVPENRQQTAQDVTEEYVDLEARIENERRLEGRIVQLLEDRTGKIGDVIEVERELGRVRQELERMQGRLRYLKNRVALTTITVTAREEQDYVPPQAPGLLARISRTWGNSLAALRTLAAGILIALVALTPFLLVALPFVWLGFRLYRRHQEKIAAAVPYATLVEGSGDTSKSP